MAEPSATLRYNHRFPAGVDFLSIEFWAFRESLAGRADTGHPPSYHFKRIVGVLWPKYDWFSWNEDMLEKACQFRYVAVTGPASSAKTSFFALFVLVTWCSNPRDTLVLLTSTSIKMARRRIWAEIVERYQGSKVPLPGKLIDSLGFIRANDGSPETIGLSERSAIMLVAPDAGKETEAVGKIIGLKAPHVIVVADELTDMSPAVVAACANLEKNPRFNFFGLGNADSKADPHGQLCEPVDGWESVGPEESEWPIRDGVCLHLDGAKTPNSETTPPDRFPYLIKVADMERDAAKYGEDSAQFWRFNRGFWCPQGRADTIYNETVLAGAGAFKAPAWSGVWTPIAFLDPAYKTGGDRYQAVWGGVGRLVTGETILAFLGERALKESITSTVPVNQQIARQFVSLCRELSIEPWMMGMDATAGGAVFADLLAGELGSNSFLRTEFGGAPLPRPASETDRRDSRKVFKNRVTQIWFGAEPLLRGGLLRGLTAPVSRELCARTYRLNGEKLLEVQPKREMKQGPLRRSPDLADAFLGMIELARERRLLQGPQAPGRGGGTEWLATAKRFDIVSRSEKPRPWDRVT